MRRALWAALPAAFLFTLCAAVTPAEQSVEVRPGDLYPVEPMGAARYRNFHSRDGSEVYLGEWRLPEYPGRAEVDFARGPLCDGVSSPSMDSWQPSNPVVFSFFPDGGLMRTDLRTLYDYCLHYPLPDTYGLSLNHLQIDVWRQAAETTVHLENVRLCTVEHPEPACLDLGSFVGSGKSQWHVVVHGTDLSGGFDLKGFLVLSGSQPSGTDTPPYDVNKVELQLGHYYGQLDEEGPPVTSVEATSLGCNAEVVATVDDTATGNAPIAYAEYTLDAGIVEGSCLPSETARWLLMEPVDGGYDGPVEVVSATFDASQPGQYCVCVQATDANGEVGFPSCATLTVPYTFTGFFQPTDMGAVNTAKAGQTIPVRWRLANCKGRPVGDPTSFAGLYSYPIACQELMGDPTDAVEEYSTGSTGLKYLKDGKWQYNWKTPKSYSGRCHRMYVLFKDGTTSPMADFAFR